MPLVNFRKKISLSFLRFLPEFRSSHIYAVTKHTRNQISFERYPKKFSLKTGVYILVENGYLFPPPLGNLYFFPKKTA
jgi:hypothetical protein